MGFPKEGPGGSYMLWASPRQDRGVLHTAGFPKVGPGGLTHCRLLQGGTGGSYTLWASPRRDLGSPTCCGLSQGRTWGVLHTAGFYKVGLGGLTHFRLLQGGTGGSYTLWASPRQDLGGVYTLQASPRWDPGGLTGCGHPQGGTWGSPGSFQVHLVLKSHDPLAVLAWLPNCILCSV